jgi:sensor histidine kinase YesM
MKKDPIAFFLTFASLICCIYPAFAQRTDSLFTGNSKVMLIYFDEKEDGRITDIIADTSRWINASEIGIKDLRKNNELLIKTSFDGDEYDNPSLVLQGLSSGFEVYRDSLLIYSAGKGFNPEKPGKYFDTHIVPLEKPLKGSDFILRIHFKSLLDITGFTTAYIGQTLEMVELAKNDLRKLQISELPDFILGVFLFLAGIFSLIAFFLRIKHTDWLLFWFFVFATSQGYVFTLHYLLTVVNISPIVIVSSSVIAENLVPFGIIGIIAVITGFTNNVFIRIMMLLHFTYTILHLSLIHFDFYNMLFWFLVMADIILFVYVFIKSKIYKNPDFKLPVIALSILMVLVIFDILAVFEILFIAADLSSYGMLLVAISFAWYIERAFFRSRKQNMEYQIELTKVRNNLLSIENQNIIAQYETLKNQVNPHFLFNSLNILSSLIRLDDKKALRFIEEFAEIYRYVLDASNKTLIDSTKELAFVDSYLYLQKLRFGKNLDISQPDLSALENTMLVPLSVQILVENAIKHNEISADYPLKIEFSIENDYLIVKNQIHKLNFEPFSGKIGLKNLSARYSIITERPVFFGEHKNMFIARIPLLKMDDYEYDSINN